MSLPHYIQLHLCLWQQSDGVHILSWHAGSDHSENVQCRLDHQQRIEQTDSLTDSDTRHHDDKLRPSIVTVQFVHGLDVGVGLARTCFHFNGKSQIPTFQMINGVQSLRHLNGTNVLTKAMAA